MATPSTSPTSFTNQFKVYVAVDFGTDGLGLAYAINNEVYIHSKWNSRKYGDIIKPKTIILLDNNGNPVSFGMDAKFTYMNLATSQKNEWMLFERFKMSLYDDQIRSSQQDDDADFHDHNDNDDDIKINHKTLDITTDDIDQKTIENLSNKNQSAINIQIADQLTAVNGRKYSSSSVFISAFKHIYRESKKYLRKKKIKNINDNDIGWIITVPSIWNDQSKHKMKQWAIMAGLINKNIANQCKIVYEPDCASLSIQYQIKKDLNTNSNNDNDNEFKTGDKYILVDAGGGTVDVACHEILDNFGVKEILPPSGGKWGSCYIDDQYIKLLINIFSLEWINEFKLLSPNIYVEILHNFQESKATFYLTKKDSYNVRLPEDFICFIDEKTSDDIEVDEFVKNSVLGKSKSVSLNDEYINISAIVWKSMFDHSINPIILHIKKLLKDDKLSENLVYLCLVGGLSCSPYFQYRMKYELGINSKHKLKTIIPHRPILSVVEGAAYMGITPNYIKARRLRKTYGFAINQSIDIARSTGVDDVYIEENKYYDDLNDKYMIPGCFQIMAKKNQEIEINNVIIETSYRTDPDNMNVTTQVLCSDMENPKTVDDGYELAEYTVTFDNNNDMEIVDEFHFYDTTIKIYSYTKNNPDVKTEIELSYVQTSTSVI